MAKWECVRTEPFSELLQKIEDGILNGSVYATLEDTLPFKMPSSIFCSSSANGSVRTHSHFAI